MKTLIKSAVIIFTLALSGCEQQKQVQQKQDQGPSAKSMQEWAKQLQNKTRKEIVTLLGTPNYTDNDGFGMWYYELSLEPVTGVKKPLYLGFYEKDGFTHPRTETLQVIGTGDQNYQCQDVNAILRSK